MSEMSQKGQNESKNQHMDVQVIWLDKIFFRVDTGAGILIPTMYVYLVYHYYYYIYIQSQQTDKYYQASTNVGIIQG